MVQSATRPIDRLRYDYERRLAAAREAWASGRSVVGVVGNTVPRELILAAERVPVLIAADASLPTPTADIYMESVIPPETKALFEMAVSGELEFLDLLVLSRPYAQLYYYLKEVYRLGRAPKLPRLHMVDLLQSQRAAVRTYNVQQIEAFSERMQRLAGHPLSDASLRRAIEQTNEVRGLQRRLLDLRWSGAPSGTEALEVLGAGYFSGPEAYAALLKTYLDELDRQPATSRPRLLVLPSEPLSHLHLYAAVESAGSLIVAEDDWWGARGPGADISLTEPPHEALLRKYWQDSANSSVVPAEAREGWFLAHAVRPEIDGVIFYLPPSDHQLGWDYPRLKAWLDDHGVPSLLIRQDATGPGGREQIAGQTRAWLAELEARP